MVFGVYDRVGNRRKEALEKDDQVTDPSKDPIAEPGNNQSQKDDDDPA